MPNPVSSFISDPDASEDQVAPVQPPVIIGLYGVSGSGKSFLLKGLEQTLEREKYLFYEGSEMISEIVPGGLESFKKLIEKDKVQYRQLAIDNIAKVCAKTGKTAVVAGHYMFWSQDEKTTHRVCTQKDMINYTHIIYLDIPPKVIEQRRREDLKRGRPSMSLADISKWQETEKTELRSLCRRRGILFLSLGLQAELMHRVLSLIHDFTVHTTEHNLTQAENRLDDLITTMEHQPKTMLLLDADKTLTALDTGALIWRTNFAYSKKTDEPGALQAVFDSPMGYSYNAFRQAALLYEEMADEQSYNTLCEKIASMVTMHPEFVYLLQKVAKTDWVGAVVVTCGLRLVWEKILKNHGLSGHVQVIGGGRISDGLVVTGEVKGSLVSRLQDVYQMYVWAFGDSPLDMDMLGKSDQAIVVVCDEQTRSKSMDGALIKAFDTGSFQARQVVLPGSCSPRLDTKRLPLVQLTDVGLWESIIRCHGPDDDISITHATNKTASKLLMTPTRDANIAGPALRKAHCDIGRYLATEYLTDVIGLEEYPIPHVQGHLTDGYRFAQESNTLIVALMRGGEPMAFGVNEALPLAMFLHAKRFEDLESDHLQGRKTVILVDSVINSGKSIKQFVHRIRNLDSMARIVVVAGVVQRQSIRKGGLLHALSRRVDFSVVALRISDNNFTGQGTTDTGNRLFNSTNL